MIVPAKLNLGLLPIVLLATLFLAQAGCRRANEAKKRPSTEASSAASQILSNAPILRIEPGMHTAPITDISVNGDASLVLTSSEDATARLWELPTSRLLHVFRAPV